MFESQTPKVSTSWTNSSVPASRYQHLGRRHEWRHALDDAAGGCVHRSALRGSLVFVVTLRDPGADTRPKASVGWSEMGTLWQTYKKLWKITMFNGKINYFYGHFQVRKLLVYQRVNGLEVVITYSHHIGGWVDTANCSCNLYLSLYLSTRQLQQLWFPVKHLSFGWFDPTPWKILKNLRPSKEFTQSHLTKTNQLPSPLKKHRSPSNQLRHIPSPSSTCVRRSVQYKMGLHN